MFESRLLTGTLVKLATPLEEDLPVVTSWHQDELFLRFSSEREAVPHSIDSIKSWYLSDERHQILFGIRTLAENQLVGFLEIHVLSWPHRNAEFFIGIAPDAWDRGYGSEALGLAMAFCFRELNLHRLQTKVFSYNERALHVFNKLGFTLEGTFREFLRRNGKWFNMVLLSMLAREWRARTST
ncbi:MAG: GNAT family N-acetyltransferase [Planctomycetes bacterium]|nr:GNAT family N-acetyltransferase [Planctomycetota bacterium]